MKVSNNYYCVRVADYNCYYTAAYIAQTGASNASMRGVSDTVCSNYAKCGFASCTSYMTCPATPAGKYLNYDQALTNTLVANVITIKSCWGGPMDSTYKSGRYC